MEQVRNRWSYTSIQMHMLSHSRVPVDEQQRLLDHPKDIYGDHRHVFDAHGGPRVECIVGAFVDSSRCVRLQCADFYAIRGHEFPQLCDGPGPSGAVKRPERYP